MTEITKLYPMYIHIVISSNFVIRISWDITINVTSQAKPSIVCTSNLGHSMVYKLNLLGKTQKFLIHRNDKVNLTLSALQI